MIELVVIKSLLNKNTYNKYISLIKTPEDLRKHYHVLQELHNEFDRDLSLEEYLLHAEQKGCKYLDVLKDSVVGHESMDKLIVTLCERSWAHSAALLSVDVSEGRRELSELIDHYSKLESLIAQTELPSLFLEESLEEILSSTDREAGLQWRLPELQAALGGLNKGDFGFIFARPETGKTTFLASEVGHFAEQSEHPVIWCNNEERGEKVRQRMYQGVLGVNDDQLRNNIERCEKEFERLTKGNYQLYNAQGSMHKRNVEEVLRRYKPAFLVIDQIDKVRGFKEDTDVLTLGAIYVWARELAKQYCPIIGVCQASATGENKKWLTMDDIAKSKTEKAAEGDFIIGIGKTYDVGCEDIRYIHIIKNKLTGEHPKITCRIDAKIARYIPL